MLFPTVQFAIFFPIVLALSWALMSRPRLWKPFIIAASYVFYAAASWRFCKLRHLPSVPIQSFTAMSLRPASLRLATTFDPMKPAPPVTKIINASRWELEAPGPPLPHPGGVRNLGKRAW